MKHVAICACSYKTCTDMCMYAGADASSVMLCYVMLQI